MGRFHFHAETESISACSLEILHKGLRQYIDLKNCKQFLGEKKRFQVASAKHKI